jgi:ribosomal protein L37AE/L43A
MERDTSSGSVVFVCYCGYRIPGGPMDARLAGGVLHSGQTTAMYERLIRNSAHDRVNQQVSKDCPQCGLDYMTQIRVGEQEIVVWTCKCGYDSTRAPPRPPG